MTDTVNHNLTNFDLYSLSDIDAIQDTQEVREVLETLYGTSDLESLEHIVLGLE